jgi:hypothetical protein
MRIQDLAFGFPEEYADDAEKARTLASKFRVQAALPEKY